MNQLTLKQIEKLAPAALADQPDPRVSPRYAFISTADAMKELMEMGWHPVMACQSRVRLKQYRRSAWHEVQFCRPGDTPLREAGDVLAQLTIFNNHRGRGCYYLHGGLLRLACKNGLLVPQTGYTGFRICHTRDDVHRFQRAVEEWIRFFPRLLGLARSWREIQIHPEQEISLAAEALRLRYGAEEKKWPATPEAVARTVRRREDAANDLWTAFNRIQENVTRGGPEVPGKPDARGRRRRIRPLFHPRMRMRLSHGLWREAGRIGGGLEMEKGLVA